MSGTRGRAQQRLPHWWVLLRDILSFLGGWGTIAYEVQRADIREAVLVLAAAAIGIPGLAVARASVAEAIASRRSGTESSQRR